VQDIQLLESTSTICHRGRICFIDWHCSIVVGYLWWPFEVTETFYVQYIYLSRDNAASLRNNIHK